MKLWQKNYKINKEVEKFTVGEDAVLDNELIFSDVLGNIAHATMLSNINILTKSELKKIKKSLLEILKLEKSGEFVIKDEDEDVHTAVENYLTKTLGEAGKKIHTGRSRNDQIIVDLRLYSKEKLLDIEEELLLFCQTLLKFSRKNERIAMAGYTHSRHAMPSSVALWGGSFMESLLDDLILLKAAYEINDQSPLGSAASYGVPLNIDRKFTSELLGFGKVQNNVLYVSNSRGKIESVILGALSQIMLDLSRLCEDLILFTREEFNFFSLPDELCPGSSIMPQKKNPAPLEIVRAKSSAVSSYLFQIINIVQKLPSGYSSDLQLTKGPLMKGMKDTEDSIKICNLIMSNLIVNKEKLTAGLSGEIFATDEAYKFVKEGVPFRDAYRQIAKDIKKLKVNDPQKALLSRKHIGGTGNLGLELTGKEIRKNLILLAKKKNQFEAKKKELLNL
jgi:argininosuccinate lyase